MPRKARKDLITSFLHIMVQGVNKEYIFYIISKNSKCKENVIIREKAVIIEC